MVCRPWSLAGAQAPIQFSKVELKGYSEEALTQHFLYTDTILNAAMRTRINVQIISKQILFYYSSVNELSLVQMELPEPYLPAVLAWFPTKQG